MAIIRSLYLKIEERVGKMFKNIVFRIQLQIIKVC